MSTPSTPSTPMQSLLSTISEARRLDHRRTKDLGDQIIDLIGEHLLRDENPLTTTEAGVAAMCSVVAFCRESGMDTELLFIACCNAVPKK